MKKTAMTPIENSGAIDVSNWQLPKYDEFVEKSTERLDQVFQNIHSHWNAIRNQALTEVLQKAVDAGIFSNLKTFYNRFKAKTPLEIEIQLKLGGDTYADPEFNVDVAEIFRDEISNISELCDEPIDHGHEEEQAKERARVLKRSRTIRNELMKLVKEYDILLEQHKDKLR